MLLLKLCINIVFIIILFNNKSKPVSKKEYTETIFYFNALYERLQH